MFDKHDDWFKYFAHILLIQILARFFMLNFEELHEESHKLFGPRLVKLVLIVLEKTDELLYAPLFVLLNLGHRIV